MDDLTLLCNHPQALAPGIVERPSSAHPGEGEAGPLRAAKPSPGAFSSAAPVWVRYRVLTLPLPVDLQSVPVYHARPSHGGLSQSEGGKPADGGEKAEEVQRVFCKGLLTAKAGSWLQKTVGDNRFMFVTVDDLEMIFASP